MTRTQRRLPRRARWLEDLIGHRLERPAQRDAERAEAFRLAELRGLQGLALLRPEFTVAHVRHELLSSTSLAGGLVIGCQRCRTSTEISPSELLDAPSGWQPVWPVLRA